jgi:hypothetical protein
MVQSREGKTNYTTRPHTSQARPRLLEARTHVVRITVSRPFGVARDTKLGSKEDLVPLSCLLEPDVRF